MDSSLLHGLLSRELAGNGYTLTGIRVKFKAPLDIAINEAIELDRGSAHRPSGFSCATVKGIS